jgi:hypothetical protein
LFQYVGKVNLDDKETIRIMLENSLGINLNDLMSEIEFTEMYKAGSDIYRTASDVIVRVVNRKAGK